MSLRILHKRRILAIRLLLPATGLQATEITSESVSLVWTNGVHHTSVFVQRRPTGGTWSNVTQALPATTTSYIDSTVSASTEYEYRIRSVNSHDTVYSQSIVITTISGIPDVPTNLRADIIGSTSFRVLWNLVDDAANYRLRYKLVTSTSWNTSSQIAHPTSSLDISALQSNETYQVQIRAENQYGNSIWSTSIEVSTVLGLPTPATNLNFTNVDTDSLTLNWINGEGQTSNIVQRKTPTTIWGNVSTALPGSTSTFDETGLAPSTEYIYRIRSSNSAGTVYSSEESIITAQGVPNVPNNLRFIDLTSTSVRILWDILANADEYQVRYKETTSTSWIHGNWGTPYHRDYNSLEPNTNFQFAVRSRNVYGTSAWSAFISVSTSSSAPTSASNVNFTNVQSDSVTVNWTNGQYHSSVQVQRRIEGGSWVNASTAISASTTSFVDMGVTASTLYFYRIKSSNTYGTAYSGEASVSTTSTLPNIPTGLRAENVGGTSLTLLWDGMADTINYRIRYKRVSLTYWATTDLIPHPTTSYDFTGLESNTDYQFQISAENQYGNSIWSTTLAVKTGQNEIVLSSPSHDYKSISLEWTYLSGAIGYRIHMTANGVAQGYVYPSGEDTGYTYTNLEYNTPHEFYMQAQDSSGTWFTTSNTIGVQTDNYPTTLAVSPSYISLNQPASDFTVELLSNENWSITEQPSWVTTSGESNNGDDIFTVLYTANNTAFERTGYITITEITTTASVTIQLVQQG